VTPAFLAQVHLKKWQRLVVIYKEESRGCPAVSGSVIGKTTIQFCHWQFSVIDSFKMQ